MTGATARSVPVVDGSIDTVLVVDFGAQYAQLIARRVREARVYSEIVPHTISAAEIAARKPRGIIFSGGPKSVHVDGAPTIDPDVYDLGIPILGICYGAQLIAQQNGGVVDHTDRGEYGRTTLSVTGTGGSLLAGLPSEQPVWMSHFDAIIQAPDGVVATASTPGAPVAAFEDRLHTSADVRIVLVAVREDVELIVAHGLEDLVRDVSGGHRVQHGCLRLARRQLALVTGLVAVGEGDACAHTAGAERRDADRGIGQLPLQ